MVIEPAALDGREIWGLENRPLRILLAEDNAINQEIAKETLQQAGHVVAIAVNGKAAVEAVRTDSYDVVLMDIHMPEMDGIEATRAIRNLPGEISRIPVIALTANAMVGDRERYIAAGLNDYASKPFDAAKLLAAIQRCVRAPARGANPTTEPTLAKNSPATAMPPGLDPAIADPLRKDKPDLWKRLVVLYMEKAPKSLETFQKALEVGDREAIKITEHTLKSASANMGAARLSELCRQLGDAAEGGTEMTDDMMADIRAEFDIVADALAPDEDPQSMAGRSSA